MKCISENWGNGYDRVTVGCTIENQNKADYRLSIFSELPIMHKNIIYQPLIQKIDIERYLKGIELDGGGGESDKNVRPLYYEWYLKLESSVSGRTSILNLGNAVRAL